MAPQPRKFISKNGVNILNPEYLAWKRNGGKKSSSSGTQWQDPIDKMLIQYSVLQAKDLVAKDRNLFGKKTSSDPYVQVSLLRIPSSKVPGKKMQIQKIKLGRTGTLKKNLSPTWNYSHTSAIPYSSETIHLMFEIYDEDQMSSDDLMGVVKLPALEWKDSNGSAVWYEIPKDSAKKATGSIQLKVSTSVRRVQGLRPYC